MVLSLTHQTLLLKIRVSLDWNFALINAGPLSSNIVVTLLILGGVVFLLLTHQTLHL